MECRQECQGEPCGDAGFVHGINILESPRGTYDAVILAVSHKEFLELDIRAICSTTDSIIYDVKSFLDRKVINARL